MRAEMSPTFKGSLLAVLIFPLISLIRSLIPAVLRHKRMYRSSPPLDAKCSPSGAQQIQLMSSARRADKEKKEKD